MAEPISEELAQECLAAVRKQFAYAVTEDSGPALYQPGHDGPGWVIVWEGVHDWALLVFRDCIDIDVFNEVASELKAQGVAEDEAWARAEKHAAVKGVPLPKGVFAEPVNHYTLGLHPSQD